MMRKILAVLIALVLALLKTDMPSDMRGGETPEAETATSVVYMTATVRPSATKAPSTTAAARATPRTSATKAPSATATASVTAGTYVTKAPSVTARPYATKAPSATATASVTAGTYVTKAPSVTARPYATKAPSATATATAGTYVTKAPSATQTALTITPRPYTQTQAPSSSGESTGIAIPCWRTLTLPADTLEADVVLGNPSENAGKYDLTFSVTLEETGEVLFTTGLVPGGMYCNRVTLSRALEPGEYAAVMRVQPYTAGGGAALNNMDINFKLIIEETPN